jgi:hypothetical protein
MTTQEYTDRTQAREWLETGDRMARLGLPASALAFRNMAHRLDPFLAETWVRWEDRADVPAH